MTVPIASHYACATVHHNVVSDVEFPSFVEQRLLDIFLKDVGFCTAIAVLLFRF